MCSTNAWTRTFPSSIGGWSLPPKGGSCSRTRSREGLADEGTALRGPARALERTRCVEPVADGLGAHPDEARRPGRAAPDATRVGHGQDPTDRNLRIRGQTGLADSSGERNELGELLQWCHVTKRLARSTI